MDLLIRVLSQKTLANIIPRGKELPITDFWWESRTGTPRDVIPSNEVVLHGWFFRYLSQTIVLPSVIEYTGLG